MDAEDDWFDCLVLAVKSTAIAHTELCIRTMTACYVPSRGPVVTAKEAHETAHGQAEGSEKSYAAVSSKSLTVADFSLKSGDGEGRVERPQDLVLLYGLTADKFRMVIRDSSDEKPLEEVILEVKNAVHAPPTTVSEVTGFGAWQTVSVVHNFLH